MFKKLITSILILIGASVGSWAVGANEYSDSLAAGYVVSLDGIDDYVEVLDDKLLTPSPLLSFEVWAFAEDWGALTIKSAILDKSDQGAGGYGLWVNASAGQISSVVRVNRNNLSYITASMDKNILATGWHHFASVYDGQYLKLYVDGVLKSTADAGSQGGIGYPYHYVLRLGKMARSDAGGGGTFKGRIDEPRIYGRILSETEIVAHYNGGQGQFGGIEEGLIGGWHLDEGQGLTALDYTGNNFVATFFNGAQWIERNLEPNSVKGEAANRITIDSVDITWSSSELADSRVDYGLTDAYGLSMFKPTMEIGHAVTLSNLTPGTTYHFNVTSKNAQGQTAISKDNVFTTLFPAPTNNEFHVSTTGTPGGNGSAGSPWDLSTALAHPASIKPGATIWLHGGTYKVPQNPGYWKSQVSGNVDQPIKIMSYPGEWAILDGNLYNAPVKNNTILQIYGQYAWFMNFEITNTDPQGRMIPISGSNPPERRGNSVDDYGKGTKLIDLIIHDTGQGLGAWIQGEDNEYYGNIVYNNGWDAPDRGHGHGTYAQNQNGYKKFNDNIIFQHFGVNTRTGGTNDAAVRNFSWDGNAFFNGGTAWEGPYIENLKVKNTYTYNNPFGIGYEPNSTYYNAEITNNYFSTGVTLFDFMQGITFKNNTVCNSRGGNSDKVLNLMVTNTWTPARFAIDDNTYYKSVFAFPYWQFKIAQYPTYGPILFNYSADYAFNKTQGSQAQTYAYTKHSWKDELGFDANSTYIDDVPHGTVIFVRPNIYDKARAHVIVYNWDKKNEVVIDAIDIDRILSKGSAYVLRNVQDYEGDVIKGFYDGTSITIPMMGHTLSKPIGYDQVGAWYHVPNWFVPTFPTFGVFVLIKTSDGAQMKGDVTGDGYVNSEDAVAVAHHVVGLRLLNGSQLQNADVSGDGKVTMYDAALIVRFQFGLLNKFPADNQK